MRIGIGYDIHKLVKGRTLYLGGAEIPFKKGALGHSDGDVILHAVIDAVLGALAAGDIGEFFSDKDPKHKNARSLDFLPPILYLLRTKKYKIENLDIVVITEEPKLAPHKARILKSLALAFRISTGQIGLKAKTHEGLGPIGKGKAIACIALANLSKANAK